MTNEEVEKMVNGAVDRLGEHFEAVQILVSWQDEGATFSLFRGTGNWFSRQGMAQSFINNDVAQDNARQIAEQLEPGDDDDEDGDGE